MRNLYEICLKILGVDTNCFASDRLSRAGGFRMLGAGRIAVPVARPDWTTDLTVPSRMVTKRSGAPI
jgi:hypothetical protein